MMNEGTWNTAQRFIFAGEYPIQWIVAAGVALALGVLVLAWWEHRHGEQPRLRWLLAPLRLAALVIVLWMLAEPTRQTVTRHTNPKTLAIMVDDSASMESLDPVDNGAQGVRWAAALNGGKDGERTPKAVDLPARFDRTSMMLALAKINLTRFSQLVDAGRGSETARHALAAARLSLTDALGALQDITSALPGEHADTRAELDSVRQAITDQVAPGLDKLLGEAGREGFFSTPDRMDRLFEVEQPLAELARQLQHAADAFCEAYGHDTLQPGDKLLASQSGLTRTERIQSLLKQADSSWLDKVKQEAHVLRYRFDRDVTPDANTTDGTKDNEANNDNSQNGGISTPAVRPGKLSDRVNAARAFAEKRKEARATTDLATALEQVSRDNAREQLEAVVLLTDGQHNAERDPLKLAQACAGLPTFIVPVGNTRPVRDVILHHVKAPRTVILNDMIVIEGMVNAQDCLGEELTAELLQGGQVVDRQSLTVNSANYMGRLAFQRKAERLGEQNYALRIAPVKDERFADNNEAKFSVEVTENKIRVLLADGLPRWEHRFLRNLFKRDGHTEFSELLFEPHGSQWAGPAPAFPRDLEEWARYRVAILGDIAPTDLNQDQQSLLEQYVNERGGTLVVIAGRDAMPTAYRDQPLAKLLPVEPASAPRQEPGGYALSLTEEGQRESFLQLAGDPLANAQLWRDLTSRLPVFGLSGWAKPRQAAHLLIGAVPLGNPGAQAVSGANQEAFLTWQYYGRGRVVFIAAPVTYELRYQKGDLYHQRFWGQLLRWAIAREMGTGSKTVQFTTDKTRYGAGEPIQVTARMIDLRGKPVSGGQAQVEVQSGQQTIATLPLAEDGKEAGVYRVQVEKMKPGALTIEIKGRTVGDLLAQESATGPISTTVVIDPTESRELTETRCNLPLLSQIAEATGGVLVPPDGLATAISHLDLSPAVEETSTQRSLWDRWWLLALFCGCLGAEWGIRKWKGMS